MRNFNKIFNETNAIFDPLMIVGLCLWASICLITLYLLHKAKLSKGIRISFFIIVIAFFGFLLHGKPGAMEAIVKFFKATAGKETWYLKIFFMVYFSSLTIIGTNLFCGIACQIGNLQDLIFNLSGIKKIKIPFWLTNSIRTMLFILFVLFMYDILTGFGTRSLFHHVNIFKFYRFDLSTIGWITFSLVIILSFVTYRPFCTFICPFGFWSWILSHIGFFRIKRNLESCIKCMRCIDACPNNAMKNFFHNKKVIADCYSCGECINICPENCISYSARYQRFKKEGTK